jgi:hypothetical protein
MAVSYGAPVKDGVVGDLRYRVVDVTFDSSYPTGGEASAPSAYGLTDIICLIPLTASGYTPEYDDTNSKIKMYWVDTTVDGAALAEVANTTNLSAVTVRFFVLGK